MIKSLQQKITLILLACYWPTLFVLAHIPIPQLVRKAGVSDKSLHSLAYLILTFLLWFTIRPDEKVNWRRPVVWCVILVAAGYGAIDEVTQSMVGRTCDAMDIIANLAGILTGLFLFSLFSFRPSALFVSGITIFGITNIAKSNLSDLFPVTNVFFHLFAYAIFTALWIQNMLLILQKKVPGIKRLIYALSVPLCLLLIVKTTTAIMGRNFTISDIIASITGILTVVATFYLWALFHKVSDSTDNPQGTMNIT